MSSLLLALAGGLGAAARFVLDGLLAERNTRGFPVGTLVINVTGSALLGLLAGWAAGHGPGGTAVKWVLGTGFLGGYTTFSTASVEVVRLASGGRRGTALALALGMAASSLLAATAGLWLGSLL